MTNAARLGFLTFASAALAIFGCSSKETRPPEFKSDAGAIDNPRSCKDVRSGEPSGTNVLIDGQIANCAGDGVECSIADVSAFDGVCQIGKASAICNSNRWQVQCVTLDASAGDAALADGSAD